MPHSATPLVGAAVLAAAFLTPLSVAQAQAPRQAPPGQAPQIGVPASELTARGALRPGLAAPAFSVEKFLKGEPITALEKGKIYVIECWATWCGPCIAAMPHLSELQRELKDKGVTIIGVSVNEDRGDPNAGDRLPVVEQFLVDRGHTMDYTVAYDGAAKTIAKTWLTASGLKGIPASFVVDRNGNIAWFGHPMDLDFVLDEVIAGSWSPIEGPVKLATAKRDVSDALTQYSASVEKGDAAWDKVAAMYPALARAKQVDRLDAMLKAGQFDRAFALANAITDSAIASRNDGTLNNVFQRLLPRGTKPAKVDGPLLLRISQAYAELTSGAGDPSMARLMLFRTYLATDQADLAAAVKKETIDAAPADRRARLESMFRAFEGGNDGRPRKSPPGAPASPPAAPPSR
ncbi:MAG: TlpA family protein disulfide reductase [Phycisphaerae bacterium]|nr:TlpA family protein disulfide reductase [Phycisphaerae bacterium]